MVSTILQVHIATVVRRSVLIHAHLPFPHRLEISRRRCKISLSLSLSLSACTSYTCPLYDPFFRLLLNRFYDMQEGKGEFKYKVSI